MGKKLTLTGTKLTDLSAPRLATVDAIEAAGSLMLMEPAHPVQAWEPGVPGDSALVPNLFADNLLGLGAAGDSRALTVAGADTTKFRMERSTKGGLAGIVSKAATLVAGDGLGFKMPASLYDYMNTHLANRYYVSIWDRQTRIQGSDYVVTYNTGGSSFNYGIASAHAAGWFAGMGSASINNTRALGNAAAPRFGNADVSGAKAGGATYHWAGPSWGAPAGHSSSSQITLDTRAGDWPSFVFYRWYVEDLTVSGRTYAQVDALDQQLYTQEVLTEGGRYYGDTFTDPATVA